MSSSDVKLIYKGRIVTLYLRKVRGKIKEIVHHPGSVSILPVDGEYIYLLRQFRWPLNGYIWEVPAGTLEEGESPEECARRELKEETGLIAGKLEKMFEAYLVPGYGDEKMHFFYATDLERGHASPEPSEVLEVHKVKFDDALEMIKRGEIIDTKTIASILWFRAMEEVTSSY